ncbi:hypothetical protein [Prescottella subtropica]|uniref:hypothetical protein n=1 Tax=Prescottella subtropica TaxID=2545757 RepID=UPI0010F8C782|nr:hypothetical protein [Prescottella subtropica]
MAAQTATASNTATVPSPAKLVDAAKTSGNLALDVYEQTVSSIVDFDRSIARVVKLDWVAAVVDAQTSLVQSVNSAVTTAARTALA